VLLRNPDDLARYLETKTKTRTAKPRAKKKA
jgi:hypothetical protein